MLFATSRDLFAFLEKMNVFQGKLGVVCSLHSLDTYSIKSLLLE